MLVVRCYPYLFNFSLGCLKLSTNKNRAKTFHMEKVLNVGCVHRCTHFNKEHRVCDWERKNKSNNKSSNHVRDLSSSAFISMIVHVIDYFLPFYWPLIICWATLKGEFYWIGLTLLTKPLLFNFQISLKLWNYNFLWFAATSFLYFVLLKQQSNVICWAHFAAGKPLVVLLWP